MSVVRDVRLRRQSEHSSSSMMYESSYAVVDILGGPVNPLPFALSAIRDAVVLGEGDAGQARTTNEARIRRAAVKIQSWVRRWLAVLRYQRHAIALHGDLQLLKQRREAVAAVTVQRLTRGLLQRCRYRALRHAEEERKQNEAAAAGAKGKAAKKGPKDAAVVPPPLIQIPKGRLGVEMMRSMTAAHTTAAMLRNTAFVMAMRAFFQEKWDETIMQLEAQLKTGGGGGAASQSKEIASGDPVVVRMIFVTKKKSGVLGDGANAATAAAGGPKKKK